MGGGGISTPQIWTASICSKPDTAVFTLIVSAITLLATMISNAEPQEVVSVPCQIVVAGSEDRLLLAATEVTKGAILVS